MVQQEWLEQQRALREQRKNGIETRQEAEDLKNRALEISRGGLIKADTKRRIFELVRIADSLNQDGWDQQARQVYGLVGALKRMVGE